MWPDDKVELLHNVTLRSKIFAVIFVLLERWTEEQYNTHHILEHYEGVIKQSESKLQTYS